MSPDVLSTSRPSGLRLFGFLAVVAGAVLAGIGALVDWVTVGFPGDVEGSADVAVRGTDVWEGKLVLGIAIASLIALIVMRAAASQAVRSGIAAAIALGGLLVAAIAAVDLSRATERFGGSDGLAEIARSIAQQLGQPVERIGALLEQNFGETLRVDIGPGMPLSIIGGVVLVAAGVLCLAWARRPYEPDASPS